MEVLKFGGSSVGTPEAISKVIAIVKERVKINQAIVVVSAMSGVTDQLILLAQSAAQGNEAYKTIIQNLPENTRDNMSNSNGILSKQLLPILQMTSNRSRIRRHLREARMMTSYCSRSSRGTGYHIDTARTTRRLFGVSDMSWRSLTNSVSHPISS